MATKGKRTSGQQYDKMMKYMEDNVIFARGQMNGPGSKELVKMKWEELTIILNSETGVKRNPAKWQKAWHDWKHNTRNKYSKIKLARARGEVEDDILQLTPLEEKLVTLVGHTTVDEDEEPSERISTEVTIDVDPFVPTPVEIISYNEELHETGKSPKKKFKINKEDLHIDMITKINTNIERINSSIEKQNNFLERIAISLEKISNK